MGLFMSDILEKPAKASAGRPKDAIKHMAILQAARARFLQSGYEHARLDDIAADAGVSKLTIYSHFGNKEQLFQAMIESECLAHCMTHENMPRHLSAAERLQHFGEQFLALVLNPDVIRMYRLMMAQAEENPTISQLFYQAGPERVLQQLAEQLIDISTREAYLFSNPQDAAQRLLHAWKGELHFLATLNLKTQFSEAETRAHVQKTTQLFLRAHSTTSATVEGGLPTPPAADLSAPPLPAGPNSRQWPWC